MDFRTHGMFSKINEDRMKRRLVLTRDLHSLEKDRLVKGTKHPHNPECFARGGTGVWGTLQRHDGVQDLQGRLAGGHQSGGRKLGRWLRW